LKPSTQEIAVPQERAILVGFRTKSDRESIVPLSYSMEELCRLAETAGVLILDQMTQTRDAIDSAWLIGKGKVEEVKALVDQHGANVVIFDHELSGAQVRNLEAMLDAKIIDRTQLILDIFSQRARTREGNIQVELAQLNYLLPRLSGHGSNLSRLGGGIGTRGPGETKLETDRRHIRDRISDLKHQLEDMVRHRRLHRERRRKNGITQVAIVGYTNAGKSTLLRQLTQADVLVEDQLFATLDPTSRALVLPGGKEVILTDTVGFIQNLPHALVAAFRATLEEVCEADLLLHVVDSTSPMMAEQMKVVAHVLEELGAHQKPQLLVFNKIDACPASRWPELNGYDPSVRMSALNEKDLDRLKAALDKHLKSAEQWFRIPHADGQLHAIMHRIGDVREQQVDAESILYRVELDDAQYPQYEQKLAAFAIDTPLMTEEASHDL
jgi:GTP-binding protein HflX